MRPSLHQPSLSPPTAPPDPAEAAAAFTSGRTPASAASPRRAPPLPAPTLLLAPPLSPDLSPPLLQVSTTAPPEPSHHGRDLEAWPLAHRSPPPHRIRWDPGGSAAAAPFPSILAISSAALPSPEA